MRHTFKALVLLTAVSGSACTQERAKANSSGDSLEVLSALNADTLYLVRGSESNGLLWRRTGSGREWRADSLLGARPEAKLLFIDRDSTPDLFFSVQWEEFVFGELWLGRARQEIQAFKSAEDACSLPVLRDITKDGSLDVIDWRAGALDASECYGDPSAVACQRAYPTEWPDVWIQGPDGNYARDSVAARAFYADMSRDFAAGAERLRKAIRQGSGDSSRCNEDLANAIDNMARRARAIGDIR